MAQPPGVAVVTGAGSGIGRATSMILSRAGWSLVLAGRRRGPLDETAAGLSGPAEVIPADVGDAAQAARVVDAAVSRFGRLDALVNNAGHAPLLPIGETTPDIIDEVYRINALGSAYTIARAWPVFVGQHSGCIVNVSTLGTLDPFPGFFAYAAAKCAVNSMARSCAKEGAARNIRAFAVAPGAVETPMLRAIIPESRLPRSACLAPENVARVIVDCIEGRYDGRSGDTITVTSP